MKARRLRVLFDERVIPNYRRSVFAHLARAEGIDLTVSYWRERDPDEPAQVPLGGLPFATVEFQPRRLGKWRLNFDLMRHIARTRPEVVLGRFGLFGGNAPFSYLCELTCTWIFGTRFIYRVSQPLPPAGKSWRGIITRLWQEFYYSQAIVSCYSQSAADAIVARGGKRRQVLVDGNCMDTDVLLPLRSEMSTTRKEWEPQFLQLYGIRKTGFVLFVSRLLPDKRVDVLIDAWRHVSADVQLVVVGSGPAKQAAIRQAEPMAERVVFVDGIYDDRELAKFYITASLVAFPGYATLSTHYALCFGKPVICSEFGNEVDYVLPQINGLRYRLGNAKELAECLQTMLDDPQRMQKFGEASSKLVETRYNVQHMVAVWRKVIALALVSEDCPCHYATVV